MPLPDAINLHMHAPEVEANAILECLDSYIIDLARKNIPRSVVPRSELDLEIDELAQNIRIKLWRAMQREPIFNVKAYLRSIARTEAVDIVRRHNRMQPLALDQDGELCQGNIPVRSKQGGQDPADEIEHMEALANCMHKTVDDVLLLSPRQQQAMICALKERAEDILPLIEELAARGLDIGTMNWPAEKGEAQRLRASLSVARAKLRSLKVHCASCG